MKRSIFLAILITGSNLLFSQDNYELDKTIELINRMYFSDSSEMFFDLNKVSKTLIKRIEDLNDSINYAPFVYSGKSTKKQKENKELISKIRERNKTNGFIANKNEEWRATDVINEGNEKLPTRKFLFGVTQGDRVLLLYWHGGVGKHLHLILADNKAYNKLTSFVTLNNWDTLNNLDYENKMEEIKSLTLMSIVDEDDITMLKGQIVKDIDIF